MAWLGVRLRAWINCLDGLSVGPHSPPPQLLDRYSITGDCISPARSLQVLTSNPLSLSDPNIVRLKLTFNR